MKFLVRILFILLLVSPLSTLAQSEDDITIDDIENAFANIFKNDSVRLAGIATIEQTITLMGQTVNQTIVQDSVSEMQFEDSQMVALKNQFTMSIITNSSAAPFEGQITIDMIFVDDDLYIRGVDASEVFQNIYPESWVNVSENPEDVATLTELLDIDSLVTQMTQPLSYPLNEETVIGFKEISTDKMTDLVEGTRAYRLEMDIEAVFTYMDYEQLFAAFEELGVDMEAMMNQMIETAQIDVVIYLLGDQVSHVETTMTIDAPIDFMGQKIQLVQTATGVFSYTDFNFPLEITAPEIE